MPTFDYQGAIQAGYSPDEINSYVKKKKLTVIQQPQAQQQQAATQPKRTGITALLPLLGGIGFGALGSLVGPVGAIAGGGGGSAFGEFLAQKLSGEKEDLGKVGGEAALGTLGGVGGSWVTKLLGKGTQAVAREGTRQTLQKGTKLGTDKIEEMLGSKSLKFTGSAHNKAKQALKQRGSMGEARNETLEKYGSDVFKEEFKTEILDHILKSDVYESGNKPLDNDILNLLGRVDKIPGDKINSKAMSTLKSDLNNLTQKAYGKYKSGDISSLTNTQRAAVGMRQAIDDLLPQTIKDKGAQKTVSELTKKMSHTYPYEEAYGAEARKGVQIPVPFLGNVGMGVLSRPIQALTDQATRATGRVGSSGLFGQSIGQPVARTLAPVNAGQQTEDVSSPLLSGEASPTSGGEMLQASMAPQQSTESDQMNELFKLLALQDLQQTGGKNIDKLIKAAEFISPESKTSAKQKETVAKYKNAENIINSFESQLGQIGLAESGPQARLQGLTSSLGAAIGTDPKARVYNDLRGGFASNLIRAFGEVGTLTDADIKRAQSLIPSLGDSQYEAAAKLQEIRSILSQSQQTTLGL